MYGLKWRDYPEENEHKNFIFKEVKELNIGDEGIEHKLIEGDNLLALRKLQESYEGGIDVIYIDPPYNTGNEFIYQDKFKDVDKHSKWLSFMHKRLRLAKKLLADDGIIFVSIDDNEQAQLKLLMDKVFGEENFIKTIIIDKTAQGSNNSKTFKTQHEYLHIYGKDSKSSNINYNKTIEIDTKKYKYVDSKGRYAITNKFDSINSPLTKNKNRGYTIYYKEGEKPIVKDEYDKDKNIFGEYDKKLIDKGYHPIRPSKRNGVQYPFNWTKERFLKEYKDELVIKKDDNNEYSVYHKNRFKGEVKDTTIQIFDTRISGNQLVSDILGHKKFDYPKSLEFMKWVIQRIKNKNAIVLDFFAGSGTTGHAVMELNEEDGGNRQFILCTNNEVSEEKVRNHFYEQGLIPKPNKTEFRKFEKENPDQVLDFMKSDEYQELGIARSVTHKRLSKVIHGYKTPKGKVVKGLKGNKVKYYRVFPNKEE